ncbi:MAG TPA: hypothetical protein VKT81_05580 [Bryobacteraceae bacterium]|nr:hypothetical protein [Bryobacteraceae bacterium]
MKTVQLAMQDSEYAQTIRTLLLRDGIHNVYLVDHPDLHLDGVVVLDQSALQDLADTDTDRDRFLVVTAKDAADLSRMWAAGIRHVVYKEDSPYTAQLAIIAAELRLPRKPKTPGDGWRFPLRNGKCGAGKCGSGGCASYGP